MSDAKYVYSFGGGTADGKAEMKNLLGGKGANLAEMASLGIPVPAGFTLTTEVCTYYYDHDQTYPSTIEAEVDAAMAKVEEIMGTKFGDPKDPLLVSVRSVPVNAETRSDLTARVSCASCAPYSGSGHGARRRLPVTHPAGGLRRALAA